MPSHAEKLAIGIDIGATKIASVLLSENGQVIDSAQVLTLASEGMPAVMDRVTDQIRHLMSQSSGNVVGVGVGSPGKVDSTRGVVRDAINLGWVEVNLTREISKRMGIALPVWIQKDTNLSALGEYYHGACPGCENFIYVSVGSGLGGGIVSGGYLITGNDWYAAELGHISIDPDGLPCICGNHGCAETIASGPGLLRLTKRMLAGSTKDSSIRKLIDPTPVDIIFAAQSGDEIAGSALLEVGHALGIVMSACTAILNPSRFVIGGGLGLAGFDLFEPVIREEITRRTIPNSRGNLNIVRSGTESPAIGSACLVWYALSGKMPKSNSA
jgi:glucokinase